MEIGNMIFGNSRGQVPLPREDEWGAPWQKLCDALGISWRGHPDDGCKLPTNSNGQIETDVFRVMSYDWDAECDCGADAFMEEWYGANAHKGQCYQNELKRRFAASGAQDEALEPIKWDVQEVGPGVTVMTSGSLRDLDRDCDERPSPYAKRMQRQNAIRKALCQERGLTYPEGSAVHCDCGHQDAAEEQWKLIGGHTDSCRYVQPNFLYKPTGFRINWYKYPFRDSYMTPGIDNGEWRRIIDHCIESAQANGWGVEQEAIVLSPFELAVLERGIDHSFSKPPKFDGYVAIAEDNVEVASVSRLAALALVSILSITGTKAGARVYMLKLTEKGDAHVTAAWEQRKSERHPGATRKSRG